MSNAQYPECEKFAENIIDSRVIRDFMEWLNEKKIFLATYTHEEPFYHEIGRVRKNIEELLAEYHGIDLKKLDEERRAIIAAAQSEN